jgi:hypothetical protein
MNNRIAKKIRKIIAPTDEISRRNYRRAKKKYSKLSAQARPIFLANLEYILSERGSE